MAFEAQAAEAVPKATEVAQATPPVRKYSYSRKRQNAFDAWQEHARKSAGTTHASHAGVAFSGRHDRDLRRAIITG